MSGFGLDELTAAVHDAVIKASEIGEHAALANIQQEEHWKVLKGEDGKPLKTSGNRIVAKRYEG